MPPATYILYMNFLADLLMNLCYLLVNLAVALVYIAFTCEFTRFTRDQYIWKSIEAADLEIQVRNFLRTGCHYLRCLDNLNTSYVVCRVLQRGLNNVHNRVSHWGMLILQNDSYALF